MKMCLSLTILPSCHLPEYVRGTGPNPNDPYQIVGQLVTAAGTVVSEIDSGVCTATAGWRRVERCFVVGGR